MKVSRIILVALILTALIVPILPATPAGAQSWWNASWTHRKILSFDAREINEDLIDFPVGVFLTSDNFDFENAKADGSDIRFVDKDGTTELYFEVVEWTYIGPGDSGNFAEIWVNVPQVDQSTGWTDYIYLYYGNPSASDASNPTLVWDANFAAVYHMNDSPDGLQVLDSTANANHGTKYGSVEVDGMFGKGQQFDGVDDRIRLAADGSTLGLTASATMEVFFNPPEMVNRRVCGYNTTWQQGNDWMILLNTTAVVFDVAISGTVKSESYKNESIANIDTYVTGIWDNNKASIYVNGVLGTNGASIGAVALNKAQPVDIGASSGSPFEGLVYEKRISNVARSASWIAATNATLRDEFIYYGSTYLEPSLYTQSANPSTVLVGDTITLRARLTDLGGMPASEVWFEYGLDTSYGTSTTHAVISSPSAVTAEVTIPHGNYHYRAVASNDHGTVYGMDSSFTLLPPSDISNAQYYGKIQSTNAGAASSGIAVPITLSTQKLIDSAMLAADANDCAVRAADGSDVAFMPGYGSNPWVYYISSMAKNEQLYHHLYTGGATGGKMAYFPGDAGMTTSDAAALELGDNFELEISRYIDASTEADIISKAGAYRIYTAANTLRAGINNEYVTKDFCTGTAPATLMHGDNWKCQVITPSTNYSLSRVTLSISSVSGSPTAPTLHIRAVSGDAPTGSDLATVTGTYASDTLTFELPTAVELVSGQSYALIWSCTGNASNYYILKGSSGTNPYAGGQRANSTDAGGTWVFQPDYDFVFSCYAKLWVGGAIDSGDHTVKLAADGTNLHLYLDGVLIDTTSLGGASVNDNANAIVCPASSAMPYIYYYKITVNGTLQQHLVYQYAETPVIDISGQNNQPSSVSVRTTSSDPDVSAALVSFGPAAVSSPPAGVVSDTWKLMDKTPDAPTGLYDELNMNFLFAEQIAQFSGSTGLPIALLVFPYAFGLSLLLGLVAYRITLGKKTNQNQAGFNRGSLLVQSLVSLLVMVYFTIAGGGVIPAWLLLPFALEAVMAMMIKEPHRW